MKIQDILKEVGHERGLTVRDDGSLIGMIRDFPVLVRSINYGNFDAVSITIRTAPGDFTALKKAVKERQGTQGVDAQEPSVTARFNTSSPIRCSRASSRGTVYRRP